MKNLNIKDLLERFSFNKLSRSEIGSLYNYVNRSKDNKDIVAWFYKQWDTTSNKSKGIDSQKIYSAIREKTDMADKGQKLIINDSKQKNKVVQITFVIGKFAAVFVLGFLISKFLLKENSYSGKLQKQVYNEVSIPLGSKSKIKLSDGTSVWLNSGSTLKYPAKFTTEKREVFLEGEAFFEVKRNETCPFYVKTPEINIKVLGTKFNVKSYPEDKTVETTLVSGSIEIESKPITSRKVKKFKLEPNQKATFAKASHQFEILSTQEQPDKVKPRPVGQYYVNKQINPEIETAWKDNKLLFSKERFADIIIKLERWYDVEIILEDERLKEYRFTGTFEKETLEQALKALQHVTPFGYSIDQNNVIIFSKN